MKTIQVVMTCETESESLRDEIYGWSFEDPRLFQAGRHIGHMPEPHFPRPKTVIEALAMGWKLLAPPKVIRINTVSVKNGERVADGQVDWWLVKEMERVA